MVLEQNMNLSKIRIKNYRLLTDAELDIDDNTTLIVGRNNTAKTSLINCISNVIQGKPFSYDDYPLEKRNDLSSLILQLLEGRLTYNEFCKRLPLISVEFIVDYSLENPEANLGSLSPFIIDIDVDTTIAILRVEYRLKADETSLRKLFVSSSEDGATLPSAEDIKRLLTDKFTSLFELVILAVNPANPDETQVKSQNELSDLFPIYQIPAERVLGEDGAQNNSSLGALISSYFDISENELDSKIAEEVISLRKMIETANQEVQKKSNTLLSKVVNDAIGFGYPNGEELQLAVATQLKIDEQIKNQTKLTYVSKGSQESLPSSHNGLGYKNLIKMEFLLAAFAKEVETGSVACIPLLFIEEPESHMHPQMQHSFADYLETFLGKITSIHIQTCLTTHSAHIANTLDFSKIRYAQKTNKGVIYKNLQEFVEENVDNSAFIKKYLTLSRCDLFFADKAILVEGASERLLIPDMIEKCSVTGLFDSKTYKLPAQYYTLIEVGGAYSYLFIPFMEFLGTPCLIITDIDSVSDNRSVAVSKGDSTSNATIKWWMKTCNGITNDKTKKINLKDVISLQQEKKTIGKCHIEYQTEEDGLCGHSLEEAIRNVNRTYYGLTSPVTETSIEFTGKSKTDFALSLIQDNPNYRIPQYIKDGLVWLNEQSVVE